MTDMHDHISSTTNRLREEIKNEEWMLSKNTVNEIAGLAVEVLLQADDEGIVSINDATASAYADLVAAYGVQAAVGPQSLSDQIFGLSRFFAAALRKRRSLTAQEANIVVEDLTVRILRVLRSENQPVSNVVIASRVDCHKEKIARRMPQLRQAQLVSSWPAGRSMFNEITELGREILWIRERPALHSNGHRSYVRDLRTINDQLSYTSSTVPTMLARGGDVIEAKQQKPHDLSYLQQTLVNRQDDRPDKKNVDATLGNKSDEESNVLSAAHFAFNDATV